MAGIQTSIQIVDRVSAPMMSVISTLESTINAFEDLGRSMDDSFDTSSINNARASLAAAAEQVNHIGEEQEQVTREVHNSSNAMDGFIRKIGAAVAAYASIQTVKKVMDMSDELVSTNARLDVMNQSFEKADKSAMGTQETLNLIYASAQNARSELGAMADVVARFGNNAGDAFSGTQEVVDFANLVQKQMTIAGASTDEASNAILQLSQALGSGVLRGDELNSIFEQAPNLIQSIADYLDVPIGKIREMAKEGELSADVVKAAIFASADDINAKFDQMPMTWGQLWTAMGNTAVMQMQPVLDKVNQIANNEQFQVMIQNLLSGLATVAVYILNIMELASGVASFIADNWAVIEPILWGIVTALGAYIAALTIYNAIQAISAVVTGIKGAAEMMATGATFMATAAQYGFNAALLACPLTWIVLLIIAAVAAVIAFASYIAHTGGVAQTTFGVICGWINVVIQFIVNLGMVFANIAMAIWNGAKAVAHNMATAFQNSIANIQTFFYNLLSTAMSVIAKIAAALSKLPFVEFDASGLQATADSYAAKAQAAQDSKGSYEDVGAAASKGMQTYNAFNKGWASDAYANGAKFGDGVSNKVSNMFSGKGSTGIDTSNMFSGGGYNAGAIPSSGLGSPGQLGKAAGDTAGSTAKAAKALDTTTEELKYLRDIAERDVINRFTTANITINQSNNNSVSSGTDLDGLMNGMVEGLQEAIVKTTEGVHF